jgi:hypothetical protein
MIGQVKIWSRSAVAANGLRIREGYEAERLALGSFLLYAVIGCPSFGMINLKTKIKCQKKNKQQ